MKRWFVWACGSVAIVTPSIQAQVVGGQVVESVSLRPLPQIPVFLMKETAGKRAVVRDVLTDGNGMFQTMASGPGAYQLAFGDSTRPISVGPLDSLAGDSISLRRFSVPLYSHAFLEAEVELPAQALPGQRPARYPSNLKARGVEGNVLMRMIIDTTGRVDTTSLEVKYATAPEFAVSVREHLKAARFIPAKWHGLVVRQIVTQPFSFGMIR